jgi:hypothetical protein
MSRLIEDWVTVKPIARQTPSRNHLTWSPDGQAFTLTWGKIEGRLIELERLRIQVVKESHELISTLRGVVPSLDLSSFKLSHLRDSPESTHTSLFDIEENIKLFQPYIDHVWEHLGKNNPLSPQSIYDKAGKIIRKKAKAFLAALQQLLQRILAHFLRTSGISARPWQASSLLFRPYGDYTHNVRLLPHSVTLVSNPKAKQTDYLTYEAYWALVHHLGQALIFCLGVFRPVEIDILGSLGIPTEEHRHFIFTYAHKRGHLSTYVYDGTKVNKCLEKNTTPELAYETRALRNVQQAIVDRHFSRLHDDATQSLLASGSNCQGQHTSQTHDKGYAVDEITQGTGMPLTNRDRQMAVSSAFHAWFKFTPRNLDWERYANYQPSEDVEMNEVLALDTARRAIIEHYHLVGGSREERSQRVKDVVRNRPFLLGEEVSGHHA